MADSDGVSENVVGGSLTSTVSVEGNVEGTVSACIGVEHGEWESEFVRDWHADDEGVVMVVVVETEFVVEGSMACGRAEESSQTRTNRESRLDLWQGTCYLDRGWKTGTSIARIRSHTSSGMYSIVSPFYW